MNLLWWSAAPWSSTGYGVQTRTFLPRIGALGHSVAVCAASGLGSAILPWNGIPIFPSGGSEYAQGIVGTCALRSGADAVVSLWDIWPFALPIVSALPRWCPWTPIDTEDCPPNTAERLRVAHTPIAMSKHGQAAMARAGIESVYIPHGFDKAAYYPVAQSEARTRLRWDPDRFVALMVAQSVLGFAVPNRKCFDEQFQAFSMLKKKHGDALLYCHSSARLGGNTTDLHVLAERHGLVVGRDVLFPDQTDVLLGLPPDYMRFVYSASDVLLSASAGEGFGVPCIEAQACGCPIIGGDWSATAELVGPGWRVEKEESHEFWIDLWRSTWHLPEPRAVADRLESAYTSRGSEEMRRRAVAFAADYEADVVVEKHWKPLLTELEGDLGR